MAFTKGNSTTQNASSTGLTVSHNNNGNFLTVGIGIRGSQTVTMTYAGASMTLDEQRVHATDPERVAIFSLAGPAAGANNLVVSLSGSVLHFVSATSWTVDSGTAAKEVSAERSNEGNNEQPSLTLPASAGGMAFDCVSSEEASSPPFVGPGVDQTQIHNTGTGSYGIGTSYELAPSSGEVMSWTCGGGGPTTDTQQHCAVVYLEGGAAATYPTAPLDFQRGAFPFMVGATFDAPQFTGLANQPRESGGPHPYGGFERFLFNRLHPVFGGTTFDQALDATVTTVATLAAAVGRVLSMAATVTTTATIVRQVNKILSTTVTTTPTIVRQVGKILSATVTTVASLTAIKVILRTLSATVTTTATITSRVGKVMAATVTTAPTMIRQAGKTLAATVTTTASLSALKVILKTLGATVTTTASMVRRVNFTLAATVTTTAAMVRSVGKTMSATVTTLASLLAELGGVFTVVRLFGRPRPGVGKGSPDINMMEGRPRHGVGDGSPGPGVGDGDPSGDFYEGDL